VFTAILTSLMLTTAAVMPFAGDTQEPHVQPLMMPLAAVEIPSPSDAPDSRHNDSAPSRVVLRGRSQTRVRVPSYWWTPRIKTAARCARPPA
jgi:hypothetical protein